MLHIADYDDVRRVHLVYKINLGCNMMNNKAGKEKQHFFGYKNVVVFTSCVFSNRPFSLLLQVS